MNVKELTSIADVVSLDYLQQIQDSLGTLTGIAVVVVDKYGRHVTKAANMNAFCTMMHNSEGGSVMCRSVDAELVRKNRESGASQILTCPLCGLRSAAIPIYLKGEYLGCWLAGQACIEKPDPALIERTALKAGIPADVAMAHVNATPVLSAAAFSAITDFIEISTRTIIELVEANDDINRQNRALTAATQRLNNTLNVFEKFIDISDLYVYVSDYETGEILMCNSLYARIHGFSVEEMIGRKCYNNMGFKSFCPHCPRERLISADVGLAQPRVWESYVENLDMWVSVSSKAMHWIDGRLVHMVTCIDITERRKLESEIRHLAYYDPKMNIPNAVRLARDIAGGDGEENMFLVCFDLWGMRRINEAYGREAGDRLLLEISGWILGIKGFGLTLYRLEGDDFCILLRNTEEEKAVQLARMIQKRFDAQWRLKLRGMEQRIFARVCIGLIPNAHRYTEYVSVIGIVERILDTAQKSNGFVIYNEDMDAAFNRGLKLELNLKDSILNGMRGFSVHYQPIVDPAMGIWVGLEALCRWTDSELGAVPPSDFIPVAEQIGLVGLIGEWVLERAVSDVKAWKLEQVPHFFLDVNLSPLQLDDCSLYERLTDLIDSHAFPPEKLTLEITESAEVNFTGHTLRSLELLSKAGVSFSLDDFGTGYASLSNLKALPLAAIKTDRSFVTDIDGDAYLRHMVHIMVEFAHSANLKVIAEGVEDNTQMRILLDIGVDCFQGYLFSPPMSKEEITCRLGSFLYSHGVMPKLTRELIDKTALKNPLGGYALSQPLYRLLNMGMYILLEQKDDVNAIDRVLALTGTELGISRSYIFIKDDNDYFSIAYEWCAPGISAQKGTMPGVLFPGRWLEEIENDGFTLVHDLSALPPEIRAEFARQEVKSVLIMPLWRDNKISGMIGFDECVKQSREWRPQEVQALYYLGMLLSTAIVNTDVQKELRSRGRLLEHVLDQLDIYACVTDIVSGSIIFTNKNVRQGDIGGEAFFVKMSELRDIIPENGQYVWEYYDRALDRYFKMYDSIVRWEGGRKVHLEYAMDITQIHKYQEQLSFFASMDVLTGAFNRRMLVEKLERALEQARDLGIVMSVGFIDIDNLKYVNDQYGHASGDRLIQAIYNSVRENCGEDSFIGRYGGDEFVVVFPHSPASDAKRRLNEAQKKLAREAGSTPDFDPMFSYGVAENSEMTGEAGAAGVEKILELADSRMFESKNGASLAGERHVQAT